MRTPNGQWTELQFHTPASWNMKENINHSLYEEYRRVGTTAERRAALKDEMIGNASKLEQPPGVNGIGVHVGGRRGAV